MGQETDGGGAIRQTEDLGYFLCFSLRYGSMEYTIFCCLSSTVSTPVMLFNSLHFLVFFPVATLVYFFLPHRYRWAWLLVASTYFYAAFIPAYALILFALILVDYTLGLVISKSQGKRRMVYLIVSLVANLGMLFFFKYANFFQENVAALATFVGWNYSPKFLSILLPIGLSFHTFQSMAYVIEVYRGHIQPEKHLGIYAVYVMFFPQLVAGPIERPQHMLPQFHEVHRPSRTDIVAGLRQMLWGFFKKIVVADNLARLVDQVYNYPTQFAGIPLVLATVGFAIQLYADFSGYSDIAIGSARVLGFRLMTNFDRPYVSRSIAEFWRRWHISLSSWFRDYIYIPLGGNRVTQPRWVANIMSVFLLSGLWHGADWTYIVWGGLNGVYLVIATFTSTIRERIHETVRSWGRNFRKLLGATQVMITFCLAAFAFLFFRANSLADAWYIATHLFSGWSWGTEALRGLGLSTPQLVQLVVATTLLFTGEYLLAQPRVRGQFVRAPLWVRATAYNAVLLMILFFGYFGEQPFIYFQF